MKQTKQKDKLVFSNAVSMKVSKNQFESDLMNQLVSLGYELKIVSEDDEWLVLATNWNGVNNVAAFVDHLNKSNHFRHFIEEYNPELFLKEASKTMLKSKLISLRKRAEQVSETI